MEKLGPEFAARAARHDHEDLFVAENYVAVKRRGVLAAGIPAELATARFAHHDMLDAAATAEPSEQTTNRV